MDEIIEIEELHDSGEKVALLKTRLDTEKRLVRSTYVFIIIEMKREEYESIIFEEIKKRSCHEKFGSNMMQERDNALQEVEKLKT